MEALGGGGAERVLVDLLKRFDYDRLDVTLLLIYKAGVYLDCIPPQVKFRWLYDHELTRYYKFPYKHLQMLKRRQIRNRINEALQGESYDAIVSFCEGWPLFAHSKVMDHTRNNITWVHTNLRLYHWTRRVFSPRSAERTAYEAMNHIVAVSDGARIGFQQLYGLSDRLRVIYNVIDRERIVAQADEFVPVRPNARFVVATVGTLKRVKRQERLIEMISLLRKRGYDVALQIAGRGKLLKKLMSCAEKLGVADYVEFLGFQANPHPWVKSADIFVLSSDTEGLSTVVCEALCLGKAVVATDVPGVSELLVDDTGLLAETSSASLADKVAYLLDHPDEKAEFERRAIMKSQQFSASDVLAKIEALL